MTIFYSETYKYEVEFNPETVLKRLENMGAVVYGNKFKFIGLAGSLNGYVNRDEEEKIILFIKLDMSLGLKLFYTLWLILTGFAFIYSTYLCVKNWNFNRLPFICFSFLVLGLLFITFIGINQAATVKADIIERLRIIRK